MPPSAAAGSPTVAGAAGSDPAGGASAGVMFGCGAATTAGSGAAGGAFGFGAAADVGSNAVGLGVGAGAGAKLVSAVVGCSGAAPGTTGGGAGGNACKASASERLRAGLACASSIPRAESARAGAADGCGCAPTLLSDADDLPAGTLAAVSGAAESMDP